ncbi:hypothetical protein MKW94_009592 [Papaver nudicaule]|uniref:Nuclear pore complex protein n=1 Tax=Papaver nudicaule TaxID=74823 RepID=A0AA41UTL1_PAPNU|nr:hypothetical protein [Papaver nudicaule]
MATTAAAAGGSYEGGAGGKFQKRPLRNRNSKPYERPVTAIRNPIEAGTRNGWISRIVDPASRLITKSAQFFFSSLYRKNLPAPPPPVTDINHEQRVQFREADPSVPSSASRERATGNEGVRLNNSPGDNGIDVVEKLLKEKTFTKAEIDRLIEVMHSRPVGESTENGKKASGPSTSQNATTQERQGLLHMVVQENGMVSQKEIGQDVASPTELAKAYMGNRPSKVSPSTLGLRSQSLREDVSLLTNAPFTPKSHSMSLVPRSAVRFPAVSENGFMTPRPRGRSAIYNMARTPYSRVHNSGVLKIDAHAMTPSTSSQRPWENSTFSGGKQPSKRRISVLDSDIGSVGPIRRIRQKTNMLMSPSKAMITLGSSSNPIAAGGSYAAQGSTSSAQKYLPDESKHNNASHLRHSENAHNNEPTTCSASVPSQSTQMAQKILQQLDKLVPSPKQKSSELRLASAKGKSPAKLTVDMLQGQALRSIENVDSSRFLATTQSSGALDGAGGNSASGAEASTSRKQGKIEDNGPTKAFTFGDENAPKANGVETKSSTEDTVPGGKASEMPPRKRAFQMSAHEDYLEMDDDSYSVRVNVTPLVSEGEKWGTSMAQSTSSAAAETVAVVKPFSSSSSETRTGNATANGDDAEASDKLAVVLKKDSSSAFPVIPAPSTAVVEIAPASQPVPSVEKSEPKGQTAHVFKFVSQPYNQASPVESPGTPFGAQSDRKIETPSSTAALTVSAGEHVPKAAELDKSNENTLKAVELSKRSENVIFSPVSSATSFSFGAPTYSSLNNGVSAPTTSSFSATTTVASDASKGLVTGLDTAGTATVVSATGITNSSTLPAVVQSSSTSLPLPSSGSEVKDLESKTKQPSHFSNLTSAGDKTSTFNVFGFNPAVNPLANNTANPFVSATGSSVFSAKAATTDSGSGTAPSTNSMPNPFASAPTVTFGLSGSTAVSSISPAFGNSAAAAVNPFGPSTGFGQSSSTSHTMTAGLFSSQSAPSSVISSGFAFGATKPDAGSSAATGFASVASPGVFLFGATKPNTGSSASTGFASGTSPGGFSFEATKPNAGSAPTASTGFTFGSTPVGSSAPVPGSSPFSFTAAGPASAMSGFGTTNLFGTTSPSNDQMNMEDSMAEDVVQASAPVVSAFGQPTSSTSPFLFGTPTPSVGSPFPFGGQQNPVTPQMPSPFQAPSGEFGLGGTGSFSLGSTGGGDKSGRKILKVRRNKLGGKR